MGTDVENRSQRFRELIEPLLNDAYTFARYLSRDATVAEDVVQEAALRAFRHLDSLRSNQPRAWLLKIVRNCFYEWREKASRTAAQSLDEDSDAEDSNGSSVSPGESQRDLDPQHILERTVNCEAVRAMIAELPGPYREALVLRELNDLSYREIADLTGTPIGTVMSRLARARDLLRKMWVARAATEVLV